MKENVQHEESAIIISPPTPTRKGMLPVGAGRALTSMRGCNGVACRGVHGKCGKRQAARVCAGVMQAAQVVYVN